MADTETTDAPAEGDAAETNQTEESQDTTDWKAQARKHEREAKAARKEAEQLRTANQSEAEKALNLARDEGAKATRDELTPDLTKARLELAVLRSAGTKLADPGDALRFIDPADVSKDDGTVDPKRLVAEIDALIVAKPYLAAEYKPGPPAVAGGPRGTQPESGSARNGDMSDLIRRAAGRP